MTPNDILSYCQSNLKDVVLVESWGERGIFDKTFEDFKAMIQESYDFAKEKFNRRKSK